MVTSYLVYVSELEVVGVVLARDTTLLVHGGVSHPESEILHRHGRFQVRAAPDNKRGGPAAKLYAPAAFKNVTHRTGKCLQQESRLGCAEGESVRRAISAPAFSVRTVKSRGEQEQWTKFLYCCQHYLVQCNITPSMPKPSVCGSISFVRYCTVRFEAQPPGKQRSSSPWGMRVRGTPHNPNCSSSSPGRQPLSDLRTSKSL